MADLLLENVYKVYEGGVHAVSDFNLKIADKEFIVFVGPSGCGKSTTLRMIAGLEEITSGSLYIGGEKMNDVEPKDRNIAMVFQNYALYPHMTVFQNMAFGLKLRKVDPAEIETRVKRAASILGITDLLERKPKALSGGQRQRVALGRAIVREPNVFLLDEPLSNLDAKLRVQMRAEITKLHKKLGTTFIYVTHDQTEAMTMGDRIVVMKDGFVQQVDSPATLYEQPRNVFVATFLGSPQMNIFEADLFKDDTSLGVTFGDGHEARFSSIKAAQLANHSYIGGHVLFGIRPENIKLGSKGIRARVDVVEHLGSETIVYAEVSGVRLKDKKPNIIVKIPTNYNIVEGMEVFLDFDMEKSHLFDVDTQQSIMGVPDVNRFPCYMKGNEIVFGDRDHDVESSKSVAIPESVSQKFFDFTERDLMEIRIPSNEVYLEEWQASRYQRALAINSVVDFVVPGSDCTAVYTKTTLNDDYFIFRLKNAEVKAGDTLRVYVPFSAITFNNADGLRLNSREKVSSNTCRCSVKTKNGKSIITFGNNTLSFDDLGVLDGDYILKLNSDKIGFMFTKKFVKTCLAERDAHINALKEKSDVNTEQLKATIPEVAGVKIEYKEYENAIKAYAYDEDTLGDKNAVFCAVDGFDDYVTAVLPAAFSVYKMPVFKLVINKDSFELIKKPRDIKKMYDLWRKKVKDPELSSELSSIASDEGKISDAFYRDLEFGTGGLRGVLGAGTNRMNIHTVGKATQGLAKYIINHFAEGERSVAISYDSRINSRLFAEVAAGIFAANGIDVHMYSTLMPTPCLSYAVRTLKTSAGVMVTASHNPAKYNGYKVYGSDGCQITEEAAGEILSEIERTDVFKGVKTMPFEKALEVGKVRYIADSVLTDFIERVKKESVVGEEPIDRNAKIVYTPLNGTGLVPVTRILKEAGFENVIVVKEQEMPDGHFPTCPYPNPEIKEALTLGLEYAKENDADILIATDPDCDRVGIAVKNAEGEFALLTGNEVGFLLLDYIASLRIKNGTMPSPAYMVKTIVTSDLAEKIAEHYGVNTINVLTGFKYIGEQIGRLEKEDIASSYILGFEESYGYLTGSYVRDKDAVDGVYMIAEMFAYYRAKGVSLLDKLQEIYATYGHYVSTLDCTQFEGAEGFQKMQDIMEEYRAADTVDGKPVVSKKDYSQGIDGLPKSNVLKFTFENGDTMVVRPSGTEPKLKVYKCTRID